MKQHIPNIVTLCNLASGCVGLVLAFQGELAWAAAMVFVGAAFDFADGFVARALKVPSELGKQLDSLSDLVTFGVLPATLLMVVLTNQPQVANETVRLMKRAISEPYQWYQLAPLYIVALGAAYRLGKFNIDTRQTTSFLGLPSPANGIFFAALVLGIVLQQFPEAWMGMISHVNTFYILALAFSLLMISEIPMFAMKVNGIGWKGNQFRYILLIVAILSIILFKFAGVALTIVAYIILSIIEKQVRS